jgi:hypothetical protein
VYVTGEGKVHWRAGASGKSGFLFLFWIDGSGRSLRVSFYFFSPFSFVGFVVLGVLFQVCSIPILELFLSPVESLILWSVYGVCLSREIGGLREVGFFFFFFFLFVMCMVMISGGKMVWGFYIVPSRYCRSNCK